MNFSQGRDFACTETRRIVLMMFIKRILLMQASTYGWTQDVAKERIDIEKER